MGVCVGALCELLESAGADLGLDASAADGADAVARGVDDQEGAGFLRGTAGRPRQERDSKTLACVGASDDLGERVEHGAGWVAVAVRSEITVGLRYLFAWSGGGRKRDDGLESISCGRPR